MTREGKRHFQHYSVAIALMFPRVNFMERKKFHALKRVVLSDQQIKLLYLLEPS